uniref:Lipocalin n=1 Tax=Rhipicephalus zambeziensis TaxID=60191 RepID=A0A224YI69_9ACAR
MPFQSPDVPTKWTSGSGWRIIHNIVMIGAAGAAQGGLFVDYTLLFWDQESHCALFTRNYNSKKQCEMHVWSDHVGRHVSRCQMAYIAYCRGLPELPIYTKQCRP